MVQFNKSKPVIEAVPMEYGQDWLLWLPPTRKEGLSIRYLGQDVKFIVRVLGLSPVNFMRGVCDKMGWEHAPLDMRSLQTCQACAAFILDCVGGLRAVRKMAAWDLYAQ